MAIIEKKLDEQGMLREDILKDNPFKDCTARELHSYWLALKRAYKESYIADDNPLISILNEKYILNPDDFSLLTFSRSALKLERDLLQAIACEAFG